MRSTSSSRTLVGNSGSNDITVLLGNGDGTFRNQGSVPAGASPRDLEIADVSGDGRADVVVGNPTATVAIFLGE